MRFQSILVFAAITATAAVLPTIAQHDHKEAKGITVKGEVVDLACFVAHDGKGPKHAACAAKCLKEGQPMGLLAQDGTVYLLFGDHDDMSAFAKSKELVAKNVEIAGEAANKDGMKGITVKSVKPL